MQRPSHTQSNADDQNSTPLVSVIVPAYQHADFIAQGIESVLNQSYPNLELIITDDGSKDGTADVVRGFRDPRIKLEVFPENRGAVIAVNTSIARARGKYISLLNSDDFFLPGKLAKQVELLERRPELAAVFGRPLFVDERGDPIDDPSLFYVQMFGDAAEEWWGDKSRFQWLRHFFTRGNALIHPTMMIRREVYAEVGLYDARLVQLPDFEMWVRLCMRHDICVMREHLTAFRLFRDERNVSSPKPDNMARGAWETERILWHFRAMSSDDIFAVFPEEMSQLALSTSLPSDLLLARLALHQHSLPHRSFGLNLLYEFAGPAGDFALARELGAIAAAVDPFGVKAQMARSEKKKETLKTRAKSSWRKLKRRILRAEQ